MGKMGQVKLNQDMTEVEVINEVFHRALLYSRAVCEMGIPMNEAVKILGGAGLAKLIIKSLEMEDWEEAVPFMRYQYAENPDLFVEPCNRLERFKRRWVNRRRMAKLVKE